MVVTLRAGSVRVKDEPLTGMVPIATGATGFWPCAEAAVTWNILAVPLSCWPWMAVTCDAVERLMATKTILPGVLLSELA